MIVTNEMVRLLCAWYAVSEDSARELIAEFNQSSLLRLAGLCGGRARAVVASNVPHPTAQIFQVSGPNPESASQPGEGLPSPQPPLVGCAPDKFIIERDSA